MKNVSAIKLKGVRQNNLKNIDLEIPTGKLTVVTGPSGSGKSSLAFQTLYAEGQRRYVETFSPYVRQFFDRMDKPAVDKIEGIPPAIAIEQKNAIRTSRSTVGTLTEVNDYLKLLFARLAKGYDPISGEEIRPDTPDYIADWAQQQADGKAVLVLFPIDAPPEERTLEEFFSFLSQQGYLRILIGGRVYRTDEEADLAPESLVEASFYVIQDRLKVSSASRSRTLEAVERALTLGRGQCAFAEQGAEGAYELMKTFSDQWHNPETGTTLVPPSPGLFSFNSPVGACSKCRGFGRVIGLDLKKAIPDHSLSISERCVKPFHGERGEECQADLIRLAEEEGINTHAPFSDLSLSEQEWVLYGELPVHAPSEGLEEEGRAVPISEQLWLEGKWYGVQGFFDWMETKAYKMHIRVFLARYRSYTDCSACRGKRLKPVSLCYQVLGKTLPELWQLPIKRLLPFFKELELQVLQAEETPREGTKGKGFSAKVDLTVELVYGQIYSRLEYLEQVGLGYLTLDRPARTLSGGEIARVNLTTCLGAALTGTLFVLDEPTVGLHPRDVDSLTTVMENLRDKGNTLVVVEHEEAVMKRADHLIDIGPGAGHLGGTILFQGEPPEAGKSGFPRERLLHDADALEEATTLSYLSGELTIPVPLTRREPLHFLVIKGVNANNLANVDVQIPLGVLTCITGVSGSGKSTLIERGLYQNLLTHFLPEKADDPAPVKELSGWEEHLSHVAFIDQSPLAKTPRSTPAVFLGAFNEVRQLFALTDDAKLQNANTGFFSFNSGAGRCERCMGNGFEKVEMQFLSDLFLTCPECEGRRFQKSALQIKYRGKSVADVLELTTDEAIAFYTEEVESLPKSVARRHRTIIRILSSLSEVGLGYLRLGQPLNTLSGGESQRIKIASLLLEAGKGVGTRAEKGSVTYAPKLSGTHDTPRAVKEHLDKLKKKRQEKGETQGSPSMKGQLLILDEPTTGLHFSDITVLLRAFQRLIEHGHSLIVVEHNLEVIKSADYLIDLGPEAGDEGGRVVGFGTPEEVAQLDTQTGRYLASALKGKAESLASPSQAVPALVVQDECAPYLAPSVPPPNVLSIRGARHHNLKNLDVELPLNSFNVITGLSGSGKSTLAFDLIFAEGQRRFLDSMSPYARQFAEQLEKPEVDSITGLPPTVAIEQRISRGGGKSTVATVTEIYHFLRLLFAKLGVQHCPESGEPVISQTEASILAKVQEESSKGRIHLMAPVVRGRKGFHIDVADRAARLGYQALLVDQKIIEVDDFEPLERYVEHDIDIIVTAGTELSPDLLREKVREALSLSKGFIRLITSEQKILNYSTERVSAATGESFEEPDPADFSFNSHRGWCRDCRGYGTLATKRFRTEKYDSALEAELAEEKARKGDEEEEQVICPTCLGSRLKRMARFVYLRSMRECSSGQGGGSSEQVSLPFLTALTVEQAAEVVSTLRFSGREKAIARDILPEITQRLHFLTQVGLGYLTLDRSATTLSGGEAQRIRLASQLGSNLQGVLYVLDEPTIGLHPRDNASLLDTLKTLQKKGNSLLVVEHDEETMARANQVIDLGPGAGRLGGEVMAQGSLKQLMRKKASVTGMALKNPMVHPLRGARRPLMKVNTTDWMHLRGCHKNNLKGIDVAVPKGRLTVITGVSGSGKSSFMRGTLQPVANLFHKLRDDKKPTKAQLRNIQPYCTSASGFSAYKYVFEVDQKPIGKTSRSCPATYVKIFDLIRTLFAQLPEAQIRGFTASRFSFNNAEGQCPECKGNGSVKLEMDFLPSTRVPCETCRGDRYNPATLTVAYNGKTIADVLRMPIHEAATFFSAHPKLSKTLTLLADTGLGYLQIGQPSPTLSGGEAQRLKLVTELTKGRVKVKGTMAVQENLYLIEEPSIGLHLNDIRKLIDVLHRLTDEGHTVVVVEHHPAIMAEADYVLDFGPEAGPQGGEVCASGTPEEVAQSQSSATAPFIREVL